MCVGATKTLSSESLISSEAMTAKRFGEAKVLVFLLSGRGEAEVLDKLRLDGVRAQGCLLPVSFM
jgi:hypothetical protein